MKHRAWIFIPSFACALLFLFPVASLRADPGGAGSPSPAAHNPDPESKPALEMFKDWPPDLLRTRGYWLPWSSAAFQRASLFGRPVVFNLTVNWNRAAKRLEEEAFADPDVLRAINANYVSVRVNADLRPDVRARYETGAWPGVFLLLPTGLPMLSQAQTRDLRVTEPIRFTALGIEPVQFLLEEGSVYWGRWPNALLEMGDAWAEAGARKVPGPGIADAQSSDLLVRWLLGNSDRIGGGFGAAPKFVVPWLEEYAAMLSARGNPELREQSRLTLSALAESALYDPVDGGLHRVAALPGFRAIEYEKMLVGNAAFVRDLTYALRHEDSPVLREALTRTAGFIVNVLGRDAGGFHLAQVADDRSPDGGAYWRSAPSERLAPPPVDPIVLTGPSALAGAALLRAGWLLEREDLRQSGLDAVRAVRREAYRPGRGVAHAIEPAGDEGSYLVSQAEASFGLLEAHQLSGDPGYLQLAREIVDFARMNLRRPGEPVLLDHVAAPAPVGLLGQPRWPLRGNVRLARSMVRLAVLGQGQEYRDEAMAILHATSSDLTAFPIAGIELALAIEEAIQEPIVVRIEGHAAAPETRALRAAAVNAAWPWVVVASASGEDGKGRPSAEVSRYGKTKHATLPDALSSAIEKWASLPAEKK
jgi:uncharacterized protein YyaL (SSP411 family)